MQAFEFLVRANPEEQIAGFALCTDDAAMTVYSIGCSREWLLKDHNVDYRFSPVEWQHRVEEDYFGVVYGLLSERLERQYDEEHEGRFEEIAGATFDAFVLALKGLKEQGAIGADVFLTVCSTDPSSQMRMREERAVSLLNSDALHREWQLGRGS